MDENTTKEDQKKEDMSSFAYMEKKIINSEYARQEKIARQIVENFSRSIDDADISYFFKERIVNYIERIDQKWARLNMPETAITKIKKEIHVSAINDYFKRLKEIEKTMKDNLQEYDNMMQHYNGGE